MADSKELLTKLSDASTESEFFSPVPAGYKKGKTKYVFVMGTVMSGLGKGIFSSCLAKLLQDKGLKVAPIKLEGYLSQNRRIKADETSVMIVLKRPPLSIAVITDPPGAAVLLNGQAMGFSPIRNLGIPSEGSSTLKIHLEGFSPWEAEVDANFPFPTLIRLTPLPKTPPSQGQR